jgi:hypothetical protein
MAEKTIQGKPCPKCFSFVPAGAEKCGVCDFVLSGNEEKTIPEYNKPDPARSVTSKITSDAVITCSKCGTENHQDFRFCKICKHPLKDDQVMAVKRDESPIKDVAEKKQINQYLYLDWITKPEQQTVEDTLSLRDFLPYFHGYSEWQGYIFLIYQKHNMPEILIKKIKDSSFSHFYKKCSQITLIESGKIFFLGSKKFQLLGDLKENEDVKTVIKSDKTIIKGPEDSKQNLSLKGRARLKILNQETSTPYFDIEQKTIIGTNEIADSFKINKEELGNAGISKKHVIITPLRNGKWLLEPFKDQAFYEEINEIPLTVAEHDVIRWIKNDQIGEFKLKIKTKEK